MCIKLKCGLSVKYFMKLSWMQNCVIHPWQEERPLYAYSFEAKNGALPNMSFLSRFSLKIFFSKIRWQLFFSILCNNIWVEYNKKKYVRYLVLICDWPCGVGGNHVLLCFFSSKMPNDL